MIRKTNLFLLSLLLLFAPSAPSSAYAPNCTATTAPERQYVGGNKSVPIVWGGSVNIETQYMELCPTSSYSLWVGLTNIASGGAVNGWVQMGYLRYSDMASNAVYTEAQSATGLPTYYKLTKFQVPSGTNNYKVDFYWGGSNATSKWQFWQNSTLLWEVPYNTLGISPNRLDVTNEMQIQESKLQEPLLILLAGATRGSRPLLLVPILLHSSIG